jgi:hypothetical protein
MKLEDVRRRNRGLLESFFYVKLTVHNELYVQ